MTLRHIGLTVSEAGRKLLASFYLVLVVAPVLLCGIWWLLAIAVD